MHNSGKLGMEMPHFSLQDVFSQPYNSNNDQSDVLVVMFICGHCPYVQAIENRLIALHSYFNDDSVTLVGICSNDPIDYPADSRDALRLRTEELGIPFR